MGIRERADVTWSKATRPGLIVGEFVDDMARRYVMLANASWREHVAAVVDVRGRRVFQVEGADAERELPAYEGRAGRFEGFIMPGQAVFVRVEGERT